ncbi:MAG: DUF885 domain-containing protein [Planctomycetes bacterium]|nr:DUF885 domain-containing protein [Planctomycetota bacterium]
MIGSLLAAALASVPAEDFEADLALLRRFHPLETPAVRERLREFLAGSRRENEATARRESLTGDGRVDHALQLVRIEEQLARLAWSDADAAAAAPLLEWLQPIAALEAHDRSGAPFTAAEPSGAALARAAQLADAVDLAVEQGAVAAVRSHPDALRHARERAREAQRWLADWSRRTLPTDPLLDFWCRQPAEAVVKACERLAGRIDARLEELKQTAEGNPFAIGRERYAALLAFERIALTPEEMLAFGQQQLAELQDEIGAETAKWRGAPGFALPTDLPPELVAAAEGPAAWRLGLELAKRDIVPVGAQRDFVQQVALEAIAFVQEQRLFEVPPLAAECWRLKLSDLETQKTLAFGYYGGEYMGVGAPLPAMEHSRKVEALRSNARPTTRTVVPHELIPGHHLQGFHVDRRPARAPWHSPFFVEGWAVHGEWLMDRHGFFRDPRERIGHLFWRLLRAARIVVSTRFHLREWTPAQMVDFMVEQAGLERSAAQAEVDRYMVYSPLYQCAYLYGAWQIRQLREECRAQWDAQARAGAGPGYDDVRFHRRLVEQGSIPLAFARMAMLDEREVRPWK